MSHSKLGIRSLGSPQHFVECGIKDCDKNCQFYCNPCRQQLCKQCRDEHLKNPDYKNHEVILYHQQQQRKHPVEKCHGHSKIDMDMLCLNCSVPLCYQCYAEGDHKWHDVRDFDIFYEDKMAPFYKVDKYFLPTSQDLQKEIKTEYTDVKMIMDNLRTAIKAGGESLKNMVDTVVSENIQKVDNIERPLLKNLQTQETTFNDYISYLNELVKEFRDIQSSTKLTDIVPKLFHEIQDIQDIRPIPWTTKQKVTPVFTAGRYEKDDIDKLLGKINIKDTKAEMREIKPMEMCFPLTPRDFLNKEKKQCRQKEPDVKQTIPISPSVSNTREFSINLDGTSQVSLDKSSKLWVSDLKGSLVQTDLQGNEVQKIQTDDGHGGYHTVTQEGDLIFTDSEKKVINKMATNKTIKKLIKTRDWTPISIHSSHINGNILVGMTMDTDARVTRYKKTGKELEKIQYDNKGQRLYRDPAYITENINGDICVSDYKRQAVVVVNKSEHRFSYTGQDSEFYPSGICTDVFGHIVICDINSIHLLDQDGEFLSLLPTSQLRIYSPQCVCMDDKNYLYIGQRYTNTVTVYKYLK